MTLYEFNTLDFENQQKTVWEKGVFLDNYKAKEFRINCYTINMFFVQVYYNTKENKIFKIDTFKTGENLNRYSKLNL